MCITDMPRKNECWFDYLDFLLQFTLEAGPHNFALTRLKAIGNGRDGTDVIRH